MMQSFSRRVGCRTGGGMRRQSGTAPAPFAAGTLRCGHCRDRAFLIICPVQPAFRPRYALNLCLSLPAWLDLCRRGRGGPPCDPIFAANDLRPRSDWAARYNFHARRDAARFARWLALRCPDDRRNCKLLLATHTRRPPQSLRRSFVQSALGHPAPDRACAIAGPAGRRRTIWSISGD